MAPRRRAFTIVELMVAFLLGVAVLAILWNVYVFDQRRFQVDQHRFGGLSGAIPIDEALSLDLEMIAPGPGLDDGVTIGTDPPRLSFWTYQPARQGPGPVPVAPVSYGLDPREGRVVREAGGVRRVFRTLLVEDLDFSLQRPRLDPGLPLLTAPAPMFGADQPLALVRYRMTCISEALSRDSGPHERVTVLGALPVPPRASRLAHPFWNPTAAEAVTTSP